MLLEKRIPFIYLFRQVRYDLLFVLLMSFGTYALKRFYGDAVPRIPVALPAFLGTAISLLLSFKLNQSYDRWWEARKIWGAIVNDSRTLAIQVLRFNTPGPAAIETARNISYRQIGWAYCLGQSLRQLDPLSGLNRFISEKDLEVIKRYDNKPLALLDLQTRDVMTLLHSGHINAYQQVQIDATLVQLCKSQGQAERIRNTVFPVTYRQILRRFIYLFLIIMSFALLELNSIWEIPLDILISLPFFMIEKTATYMQDPFRNKPTDTAVTNIAATIETNIKQLWNDNSIPQSASLQDKFYIL